jgi:hypothetical protein
MKDDFAVFILTHGRPDRVYTYDTLRKSGYTGRIIIFIDNHDKTAEEYKKKFSEMVYVFDKDDTKKKSDSGNNFNDFRSTIYPRNAMHEAAKNLGIKYFIQLDDDYVNFNYRFDSNVRYNYVSCINLDDVFAAMLNYYKNTNILSLCMSQNGDFMGGGESDFAENVKTKRKGMNFFICSTDRPFKFFGQLNEDVNTSIVLGSAGKIFLTINQVSLQQKPTQSNPGGMTEIYLDSGTYVKSFYSVMYMPSAARISQIGYTNIRIHHNIKWKNCVPKIISESYKK